MPATSRHQMLTSCFCSVRQTNVERAGEKFVRVQRSSSAELIFFFQSLVQELHVPKRTVQNYELLSFCDETALCQRFLSNSK